MVNLVKEKIGLDEQPPLREPTFWILVSLAQGEKHGYAILQDVTELSQGRLRLSTGTLYEALARLLEQGLICRCEEPGVPCAEEPRPPRGKPRKSYALTPAGRRLLQAELRRVEHMLSAARRMLAGGAGV